LPTGHFSDAIRIFAHVEHPHFRQRPVPLSADRSQKSHDLQVSWRFASVSGVAIENPLAENLRAATSALLI
jgi:hypothetical protein